MRKLATLSLAVVASFALAGAASATLSAAITGPTTPGTNTYTLTMTYATGDCAGTCAVGVVMGVVTTGTYTGVFTDPVNASFPVNLNGAGVLSNGSPVGTGAAGLWGHVAGAIVPGGTYTLGTVEITVGVGDTINPDFSDVLSGFTTSGGLSTVKPLAGDVTGVTIIPEPTTAALLGLGIVGLVMAGRRGRP